MNDPFYPEIKAIFSDYNSVKRQLYNRTLIMTNYPKVIAMTIGSFFENIVSKRIDDFLTHPISTPTITIPSITGTTGPDGFTAGGNAYKKFDSTPSVGPSPVYNAQRFYNLFGSTFKNKVENEFNRLYNNYQNSIVAEEPYITHSYNADPQDPHKEDEFEEYLLLDEALDSLNFFTAEQHLMMIKNQRNRVAHNFADDYDLSVDELRQYYYRARIYVKALEIVFESQTDISLHITN